MNKEAVSAASLFYLSDLHKNEYLINLFCNQFFSFLNSREDVPNGLHMIGNARGEFFRRSSSFLG